MTLNNTYYNIYIYKIVLLMQIIIKQTLIFKIPTIASSGIPRSNTFRCNFFLHNGSLTDELCLDEPDS